jgi:ribosomal protein S21
VGQNETFESALRRFNKKIQESGILAEAGDVLTPL